jgi:hypothetical protein
MNAKKIDYTKKIIAIILDIIGISIALIGLTFDLIKSSYSSSGPGFYQIILIGVGLAITGFSIIITPPHSLWQAISTIKAPSFVIFSIGILLCLINLSGFVIPLRNPAVDQGISYAGKERKAIYTAKQVYDRMNRIETIDEQYPEYVKRLTQLIFDGTVHYWDDDDDNSFNLRIPIQENYLLYFIREFQENDQPYEFCRAERAIKRSASVCSQTSKIIGDILIRNKVKTQIITLDGHVVVHARINKKPEKFWVLDADYGVVIEHDIEEIAQNPSIIRKYYEEKGYSDTIIDTLITIYGAEGNQIIFEKLRCEEEDYLYLLKWLIPIICLLPFSIFLFIHRIGKAIPKNKK